MLFSIIIAAYNVEQCIVKCLKSVESQTCKDYEVIIIDDGSTDRTGELIQSFIRNKKTFRLIYQKNSGLGEARNTGLSVAKGEYLIFIDGDDWIENDYLKDIQNLIIKNQYDIIRCGWIINKEEKKEKIIDSPIGNVKVDKFLKELIVDEKGCQVWKNVYKRSLWCDINFPKRLYEDLYVTHEIVSKSHTIYQIDGCYYNYLIREGSISNSPNPYKARDIFLGFYQRYQFALAKEMYDILPMIYFKVAMNAIQAIHGLAYARNVSDLKYVNFLFKGIDRTFINTTKLPWKLKVEIKISELFPQIYIMLIRTMKRIIK